MPFAQRMLATVSPWIVVACTSTPAPPLATRLATAPPGSIVRVTIDGDTATFGAPILPAALPDDAARVVQSVQPDGAVEVWQERRGSDVELRVQSRYAPGTPGGLRVLRLTPAGEIRQRMHALDLGQVPDPVLAALAARRLGEPIAAFAVEGADDTESLRVIVLAPNGARLLVDTDLDGAVRRLARLLDATVEVALPPDAAPPEPRN